VGLVHFAHVGTGLTQAMVRHSARHEWAVTVEDRLARRWRALFLDARAVKAMPPWPPSFDNQPMQERWKPSVTVAAIIARQHRGLSQYLLVEEMTPEGLRLNNPAGHLDPGESPIEACAREALEETAHLFVPTALVGVYLSRFERGRAGQAREDITYLRFAFCGELGELQPGLNLDEGIVRTVWMSPEEILASAHLHRSPLLVRCMQDHLAGRRYPLELLSTDPSVYRFGQDGLA
jgi:8-oxo-dGTP pyrophosphatase MutT (NUDIX family)